MPFLQRSLGLQHASAAERRAAAWVAVMFCFAMASTFVLRPLRDQFGVDQGVAAMPRLYTWTLVATVVAVLPFWWLANRMPSRRFVPIVVGACAALLLGLATALGAIGEYDWRREPALGEWFWGGYSAFNVVVPSLVWIHAVEHFRTEQARRLFGLVGVGGTLGAVVGSALSGWLFRDLGVAPSGAAVASAVLLAGMLAAYRASLPACRALGTARAEVARGGVLEGLRILAHSRRAQAIGLYMMMLGAVATAFYYAQTQLVGEGIGKSRDQHVWFANVEFWSQSLVLVLQLFCTGRLLQRWPPALLLVSLPLASLVGLAALQLAPAVRTINLVQIGRRGAQFAFEKPAREVLYTPLSLATKHKVKFLLDTFAFRLGDLAGAWLVVASGELVRAVVGIVLAWIVLGFVLGRRQHVAPTGSQPLSTS